jgi:uncharacterized protein YbcV (DUF1398 family)
VNAETGFVVGFGGTILKTSNGGNTWTAQSSGTTNWLESVYFTDINNGYVAGDKGTILKTTDGGTNWTILTSGTNYDLYAVYFSDPDEGCVVGSNGTILKTTNGGIVAVNEIFTKQSKFSIYPNPAHHKITVSNANFQPGETSIWIIDIQGKERQYFKFSNQEKFSIDVSKLPEGFYLMEILTNSGIETKKFMKQ